MSNLETPLKVLTTRTVVQVTVLVSCSSPYILVNLKDFKFIAVRKAKIKICKSDVRKLIPRRKRALEDHNKTLSGM